jgi:hypothetical protein
MNGICTDEVLEVMDVTETVDDILTDETVWPLETVYVPVEPVVPVN